MLKNGHCYADEKIKVQRPLGRGDMSLNGKPVSAAIRAAIEHLIYEHAWLLDNHKSETLAELYVPSGRLHGIRLNCNGADEIAAYGKSKAKAKGVTARHLYSNLRLSELDDGRVLGNVTITLFRSVEDLGNPAPIAVADATDTYVLCADGCWRFEERFLKLVYEAAAHKNPPSASSSTN